MRSVLVLAVAALAIAACSDATKDVNAPDWTMRACDQARIDLAKSKGQPSSLTADAEDPRLETSEVWDYVSTTATTKTTDRYTFAWPAGATSTASCTQTHTTTTVAR